MSITLSLSLYLYLVFCIAATSIYIFTHDAYHLYSLRVPQSTHRIQIDTIKCPVNSFVFVTEFLSTHTSTPTHIVSELLALSATAPHASILLLNCIFIFLGRIYFHSFIFHDSSFIHGAIVSSQMDSDGQYRRNDSRSFYFVLLFIKIFVIIIIYEIDVETCQTKNSSEWTWRFNGILESVGATDFPACVKRKSKISAAVACMHSHAFNRQENFISLIFLSFWNIMNVTRRQQLATVQAMCDDVDWLGTVGGQTGCAVKFGISLFLRWESGGGNGGGHCHRSRQLRFDCWHKTFFKNLDRLFRTL